MRPPCDKTRSHLMRRLLAPLAVLALAAALVAGCGSRSSGGSGDALDVVVTTTQLGDVVRAVGGGAVDVHQILRPNTDPHDYEPRPRDIQDTAGAKLVVTSGDGLDAWMGEVLDNAGGDPTVLDAGAGRPFSRPGESSGSEASRFDAHWWHDPRNVQYAVRRVRAALVAAGADRAVVDRGAAAYLRRVQALDRGIQK